MQLDILATFEVDNETLKDSTEVEADHHAGYNCTNGGGSAGRGALGPFGLIVFADKSLSELTPIYFYIAIGTDGRAETHFCTDQSRFGSCCLMKSSVSIYIFIYIKTNLPVFLLLDDILIYVC